VTFDSPAPADHYDVVIVGAGISGIDTAWRLQERRPRTTYVVLEARERIGGTWDLFRYPGIRSDSDMAAFAFPFRPWPAQTKLADGAEIRSYVADTAREAGIVEHVRFGTTVREARWSTPEQRWTVAVDGPGGPQTMTCGFLHLAAGYYDYAQGYQPHLPGRQGYEGTFVHPQHWPPGLDVAGRRVVVIGSGATAMTLVPALAHTAARVTMLQRSPSWVASVPSVSRSTQAAHRWLPAAVAHRVTRLASVVYEHVTYAVARRHPERFARLLRASLRRDLPDEDLLDTHFTPDYPPWDQRVCLIPDGDLTRAIADGRADVVTGSIETLTGEGVRLTDGRHLAADIVVSATGLRVLLFGGMTLVVDGERVEPASRIAYRGLMLEGVPNLTFTVGSAHASWTLRADLVARYLCRLLAHLERRGYAVVTPGAAPPGPRRPLITLQAGYIRRAQGQMPRLGTRRPWTVPQNYFVEALELLLGRVGNHLVFTPRHGEPTQGNLMKPPKLPPLYYAGGTAVVTGAAGGIGEQLARQLAAAGSHLALVDRKADLLDELVRELRSGYPGLRISAHPVDLAAPEAIDGLVGDVLRQHEGVTVLVNNAGVALAGAFDQLSTADIDWLLQVNLHAPIALTKALLPTLTAHPGGHVINVSSLFGLVGPAGQTAYATSKFGLRGFSDALRGELMAQGVGVTTAHPGGVATRIAADSRTGAGMDEAEAQAGREAFGRLLTMEPAAAARTILAGARRRRARVLVGWTSVAVDLVERLAPTAGGRILTAVAARQLARDPGGASSLPTSTRN